MKNNFNIQILIFLPLISLFSIYNTNAREQFGYMSVLKALEKEKNGTTGTDKQMISNLQGATSGMDESSQSEDKEADSEDDNLI